MRAVEEYFEAKRKAEQSHDPQEFICGTAQDEWEWLIANNKDVKELFRNLERFLEGRGGGD